jgi:O-succinylbenzoic acid--CoA ligase
MIWEYNNIGRSPEEWLRTFSTETFPEGILGTALKFLEEWTNGEETVWVRTSGSTGKPAEMPLSKTLMRASAQRTISFFGLKPGMRALLCLSPDHIAGKMMIVRALECGMDMVLREPGA